MGRVLVFGEGLESWVGWWLQRPREEEFVDEHPPSSVSQHLFWVRTRERWTTPSCILRNRQGGHGGAGSRKFATKVCTTPHYSLGLPICSLSVLVQRAELPTRTADGRQHSSTICSGISGPALALGPPPGLLAAQATKVYPTWRRLGAMQLLPSTPTPSMIHPSIHPVQSRLACSAKHLRPFPDFDLVRRPRAVKCTGHAARNASSAEGALGKRRLWSRMCDERLAWRPTSPWCCLDFYRVLPGHLLRSSARMFAPGRQARPYLFLPLL